jgi:Acetyltransferase (GNAT) domain
MRDDGITVGIEPAEFLITYEKLWQTFDSNSFFRSPAHLNLIAELTGARLGFAVAWTSGTTRAALPFAVKEGKFGPILNALPFYGSCSGIVGEQGALVSEAIFSGVHKFARSSGVVAATLVDDWRLKSFATLEGATYITERTNQFIDLTSFEADNVANHYHQKTRNIVRKAAKLGVTVRRSSEEADFDALQRAHNENMAAVGGLAKPTAFFEYLKHPGSPLGQMSLYVARHEGRDCAYLLNFYCGDTVEYYMPAVFVADRALQPVSLLIHTAISDAKADGYAYWNFGGTWLTQDSLRHFKIRWGSSETAYRYFTYLFDKSLIINDRAAITREYPYFFVVPFDKLPKMIETATS